MSEVFRVQGLPAVDHLHHVWAKEPPRHAPYLPMLRWRYVADLYDDAPLAGMVTSAATGDLWATCFVECPFPQAGCAFHRRFFCTRLAPGAAEAEAVQQAVFRRYVGTHWDYGADGHRNRHGLREYENWQEYYDRYPRARPQYPEGELVGWFEIGDGLTI